MTKLAKLKRSRSLKLGWPDGISLSGAGAMEQVVAYLYTLRAMSRNQIERVVAPEHVKSVRHWLSQYPYIVRRSPKGVVRYYDMATKEWRESRNFGVYTLPNDVVHAYEEEFGLAKAGYVAYPESKLEPKNLQNAMQIAEIYMQLWNGGQRQVNWLNNQQLSNRLAKLRKGNLTILALNGGVQLGENGPLWGFMAYLKSHMGIVRNVTQVLPYEQYGAYMQFVTWVRGESEENAIVSLFEGQKKFEHQYVRIFPYEWFLEHPEWLYQTLNGNRWVALEPYLEMKRRMGCKVERTRELGTPMREVEPYMWRVTEPGGGVEYVDMLTGATLAEGMTLLLLHENSHLIRDVTPRVLFAGTRGALDAWAGVMRKKVRGGIQFRLIDWPGGK